MFQNVVCGNLQILIDGKIHVIAGNRCCGRFLVNGHNLTGIVDINGFQAFSSLQGGFHVGFDTGTSHYVVYGITGTVAALFQISGI